MGTIKQEAQACESHSVKNIAELPKVSTDFVIEDREGTNDEGKTFSYKVINADGRYDARLTDYIYEAKKIILKAGKKGDAYGDYATYWIGWTGGIGWGDEEIEIDIEDLRTLHA